MHAGTAAAAATAATGGAGTWLFSYNKENFGYDAGMRFGRFTMARTFVNAQVAQYREDIHGITEATVSKMDAWQTITTCFLAVGAALSCAGRIGMHGAAPPGWFCALFSGCIFMSVLFNGISLWLSMHASLRAQCGAVSLLTRKVRLQIPSSGQLDQARVFGSAFEKQETRDIFRVPFMKHAQDAPDMPSKEAKADFVGNKKAKKVPKDVHDPHTEFASTARQTVPSWIRDEVVTDKGEGHPGRSEEDDKLHELLAQPTHFKLLMEAQEEWRDYDVYARISMLYGVISFLYAVCYYGMGTAISELRGFWVMWTLPLVFVTAQALILRLDILRTGRHWLPNAEFIGHAAPFVACAACTLEYRYYYSQAQAAITFGLAVLAFFCHFVMALRMLDLARPVQNVTEMPEEPGRQWWPASWSVPNAFQKNLWFITPPKKLEDGQHCLVHEMEDMKIHGGGVCRKRRGNKPAAKKASPGGYSGAVGGSISSVSAAADEKQSRTKVLPWKIVRTAILATALQWFFMMVVTGAEVVLGPESLLKPPGEPPWIRDTKYRSWSANVVHLSSGAIPEGYRLFSASDARYDEATPVDAHDDGHDHSSHRRLVDGVSGQHVVLEQLLKLAPLVAELTDRTSHPRVFEGRNADVMPMALPGTFLAAGPLAQRVEWPSLFEPRHIVCGPRGGAPGTIAALSRRGFGAFLPRSASEGKVVAEPFALEGASVYGPLAGASWTENGLHLVTTLGNLLHCPGHAHTEGSWSCHLSSQAQAPIPKGAELLAAALRADDEEPLLALVFKHMPKAAALYKSAAGVWTPAGEIHMPAPADADLGLSFHGNDLLLSTGTGEVHQRALGNAGIATSHPAPTRETARRFRSACVDSEGKLTKLALWKMGGNHGAAWAPELVQSV